MAEWQWKRWDAVARLGAGKLTLQEAARVLRLSVRQVRRTGRSPAQAPDGPRLGSERFVAPRVLCCEFPARQ